MAPCCPAGDSIREKITFSSICPEFYQEVTMKPCGWVVYVCHRVVALTNLRQSARDPPGQRHQESVPSLFPAKRLRRHESRNKCHIFMVTVVSQGVQFVSCNISPLNVIYSLTSLAEKLWHGVEERLVPLKKYVN